MNIFKEILIIEISELKFEKFKSSADLYITKGTEKILSKLTTAVNEIESATSPFANLVSTLDVTPPGAAAITITPIAISNGGLNIFIKINAIIGSRIIWKKKPIKKSLKFFITLKKSLNFKPNPSPNMIIAKAIGAIFVAINI